MMESGTRNATVIGYRTIRSWYANGEVLVQDQAGFVHSEAPVLVQMQVPQWLDKWM